ncbi:MAG TPA: cupin domain-containing protein [Myxococcota bacterium]|nr:cupin domain-containing protein [Myxococcota bacterium]
MLDLVERLGLQPHPEGGFYRELYRAPLVLPKTALPDAFGGDRSAATAIYFLLTADTFSALHRIAADELWVFLGGDPLEVVVLDEKGSLEVMRLGPVRPMEVNAPFAVVPGGRTFGARVAAGGHWALVSCVVAPGFDFADFELCSRDALVARFPGHAALIGSMTRG